MEIKYVDSITEKISDIFYIVKFLDVVKKYKNLCFVVFVTLVFLTVFSIIFPKGIVNADGLSFYVEGPNPSCNDAGPGSEAIPFCTIQKAANTATYGDTVYVKAGVYPERVIISSAGTAQKHIRFETFNSDTVEVQGGFELNGSYIDLEGFLLTDTINPTIPMYHSILDFNGADYSSASNITVNGISTVGSISFIGDASYNIADNINVVDAGGAPHFHTDSGNNIVRNSNFTDIWDPAYFKGHDNLIESTNIKMKDEGNFQAVYYIGGSINNTIRNCVISNVHDAFGQTNNPPIFHWFEPADIINFVLENNIFGSEHVTPWGSPDPDIVFMSAGIDFDITGPVIIRNNVIFGGINGSIGYGGSGSANLNNFQIYNNLFYGESNINPYLNAINWNIRNNIFYGPNSGVGTLGTGSTSDYNMYVNQNPSTIEGIHSFRNDNPQFVNPDVSTTTNYGITADWRPLYGSPLINAGVDDDYSPMADKTGSLRDTNPDIGPFEYIRPTYNVSTTVDPISSGSIDGGGNYYEGSNINLVATPNSGYYFSSWSGDCIGKANTYIITNIQVNKFCTAHFKVIPYLPPVNPPLSDITAPTITILRPNNYNRLSGTVDFEITASDASGIEYISLLIDGIERARATSTSLIYSLNTKEESEEFHDVKIISEDTNGNKTEKAIIIFIDNVESEGITQTTENNEKEAEEKQEDIGIVKKVTTYIQGVAYNIGEAVVQVVSEVAEGAEEIIINTPEPVARAFPYLLFALILFTGAFFSYQAYQEYILGKKLNEILKIQKVISSEKDSFINIASHYLRTPLTIIVNYYSMNKIQAPKTLGDLETIKSDTETILQDIQDSVYLKDINAPKIQKTIVGYFSNPFVWVSAVSILLTSILANYVYTTYKVIDLSLLDFLLQMVVFLLVAAIMLIAYRYRRNQELIKQNFEKSLEYEEKIDKKRNEFIQKARDVLSKDLDNITTDFESDSVSNVEIRRGMQRLREVITKFGLINSISISKEIINNTEFYLGELIDKVMQDNEEELLLKGIKIEKNISLTEKIVSDKAKIEYVVAALMANAIKFGNYNSTININLESNNQNVLLSIKNSGKTISEEGKLLLFKPFTQASESYDMSQMGMGLSLYLSRLILNYLGGDISLDSKNGITEVVAMFPVESTKAIKSTFVQIQPVNKIT